MLEDSGICYGEAPSCSSRTAQKGYCTNHFSGPFSPLKSLKLLSNIYSVTVSGFPLLVTLTWAKTLKNHGLEVELSDEESCASEKDSWGSHRETNRVLQLGESKLDISREPEGFHVTLGSAEKGASDGLRNGSEAVLICTNEHILGRGCYCTRAQMLRDGLWHDICIEFEDEWNGTLSVSVDRRRVVEVRDLQWKFRGNQTIAVDGVYVEFLWDVHGWFFGHSFDDSHAVFIFNSFGNEDDWVECQSPKDYSLVLHAWHCQ